MDEVKRVTEKVQTAAAFTTPLMAALNAVIVGKKEVLDYLVMALLTGGHVLLEGLPGLAKTLIVKSLAQAVSCGFQRIQFTPDLLPADIIGTMIYNPKSGEFTIKKGPVFTNIVLADEINRAPAKVQSALLQAMQEKEVTIAETTYRLAEPFLVLATQNPIEQEGTYPLPEAQVDRFMFKVLVGYPSRDEERAIIDAKARVGEPAAARAAAAPQDILAARAVVDEIYVDPKVKDYIVDLVQATRDPARCKLDIKPYITYGASPRAAICLTLAAKAHAFINSRGYVTPQDVKTIAPAVLRHRIILSYEAEAEDITADKLLSTLLAAVPVP